MLKAHPPKPFPKSYYHPHPTIMKGNETVAVFRSQDFGLICYTQRLSWTIWWLQKIWDGSWMTLGASLWQAEKERLSSLFLSPPEGDHV